MWNPFRKHPKEEWRRVQDEPGRFSVVWYIPGGHYVKEAWHELYVEVHSGEERWIRFEWSPNERRLIPPNVPIPFERVRKATHSECEVFAVLGYGKGAHVNPSSPWPRR
jgi:hypothetical protein